MVSTWMLWGGLAYSFSPLSPQAWDAFELLNRLDSKILSERERIQAQLTARPAAVWAVFWGSQQDNAEIYYRSVAILKTWKARRDERQLADLVRSVNGDFDRFLNTFLVESGPDDNPFARASDASRAFDRFFVKNSFSRFPLPGPMGVGGNTPFEDFADYVKNGHPTFVRGALGSADNFAGEATLCLAKCDSAWVKKISNSIIISDGDLQGQLCFSSIVIAAGNVNISHLADGSMVFAAGDIKLGSRTSSSLIIAGGEITMKGPTGSGSVLVSPRNIDAKRAQRPGPTLVFAGKPKPSPDFFTFNDLWKDFGIEAVSDEGRIKITRVMPMAPFSALVKEQDLVQSCGKAKISTIGHFRRLLRLALDTGEFEFDIERAGKKMTLRADLKKK